MFFKHKKIFIIKGTFGLLGGSVKCLTPDLGSGLTSHSREFES